MTSLTQMERWKQTQPALATVGKFTMIPGKTANAMLGLSCWLFNDKYFQQMLYVYQKCQAHGTKYILVSVLTFICLVKVS